MDLVVQWHCLATNTELLAFDFKYKQTGNVSVFFMQHVLDAAGFKYVFAQSPHHLYISGTLRDFI